jgi:hypothetical protein
VELEAAELVIGIPRERVGVLAEHGVAGRLDVHGEAVVSGLVGGPVDARSDRVAEGGADAGVLLVDDAPVELDVAAGVHPVARRAVDHDARVAEQVDRLLRAPHHRDEEAPGREVALVRADAG